MSIKRIKVKSRMIIVYYIILFTFVFVSHNISNYTSYENYINFDSWSENIMIADLIYYESYHDNSLYLKSLYPGCSVLENTHIIEKPEEIYYTYIEQEKYNEEDFQDYKSNICLHRYIYHLIVNIIENNQAAVEVLHYMTAILSACAISIVLFWISKEMSKMSSYITAIVLAFFSPYFIMYGTNLYWSIWSLFIPIIGSIFVVMKAEKDGKFNLALSIVTSLSTCIIKQLFYFEWLPVVMIAMMVPYVYYFFKKEDSCKKIIKFFGIMILTAVVSFFISSSIKILILYNTTGEIKDSIYEYMAPIVYRLLGDVESSSDLIQESSNASFVDTIMLMLGKTFISIRGFIEITVGMSIVVVIVLFIYMMYRRKRTELFCNNNYRAMLITLTFSISAPFSWFILAKPHTYVHNIHCGFIWFLPYGILYIAYLCEMLYLKLKRIIKQNIVITIEKIIYILPLILVIFILMDNLIKGVVDDRNFEMARREGQVYQFQRGNIYIHDKVGYIEFDNLNQTKEPVFVHIYTYNKNEDFINRDFVLEDCNATFRRNIAIVDLNFNQEINSVTIGQYNPISGMRQWEEHIFIDQAPVAVNKLDIDPLTDENWIRGISIDGTKVLIKNPTKEYFQLKGKSVNINGDLYFIKDVIWQSELYAHIVLNHSIWDKVSDREIIDISIIGS